MMPLRLANSSVPMLSKSKLICRANKGQSGLPTSNCEQGCQHHTSNATQDVTRMPTRGDLEHLNKSNSHKTHTDVATRQAKEFI